MNRSAKDGARSSLHYGGEDIGFHSVAPRCVRATRWGRCVSDSGRPGIVQRRGMAGIVRHSQTKGRAPGNAKPGLKPSEGGSDIEAARHFCEDRPAFHEARKKIAEIDDAAYPLLADGRF